MMIALLVWLLAFLLTWALVATGARSDWRA